MRKKIISVFLTYVIVFSGLVNCAVYADTYKDNTSSYTKSDRIIVSLGDSYSSGEGIEPFYGQQDSDGNDLEFSEKVENDDWLAHRSTKAWPGMLKLKGVEGSMAKNRNKNWFFAAVSGAETKNIKYLNDENRTKAEVLLKKEKLSKKEEAQLEGYGYQKKIYNRHGIKGTKWLEPQLNIFDQLGEKKADYVTITIGGNDLGFADVIKKTALGSTYLDFTFLYNVLFSAELRIGPGGDVRESIKSTYLEVAKIAGNQATILVVGYPRLLDVSGKGCFISKDEAKSVNDSIDYFEQQLKDIVKECDSINEDDANIEFISVISDFNTHEAYASDPYINKIITGKKSEDLMGLNAFTGEVTSSYSIHPNKNGAKAYASCVQDKIDSIEMLSKDEAYQAIKNYCCYKNPSLLDMMGDDRYTFYWLVEDELVDGRYKVKYRSYTASFEMFYIDPVSGDTYVTELVPGIIDEEQIKDGERFNARDYLNIELSEGNKDDDWKTAYIENIKAKMNEFNLPEDMQYVNGYLYDFNVDGIPELIYKVPTDPVYEVRYAITYNNGQVQNLSNDSPEYIREEYIKNNMMITRSYMGQGIGADIMLRIYEWQNMDFVCIKEYVVSGNSNRDGNEPTPIVNYTDQNGLTITKTYDEFKEELVDLGIIVNREYISEGSDNFYKYSFDYTNLDAYEAAALKRKNEDLINAIKDY